MTLEAFENAYQSGETPWDMGGPTDFVERLAKAGAFQGDVLDAGCGTGENALYLAKRGHTVVGLDFAPTAIKEARKKARARKLKVEFLEADVRKVEGLDARFQTILDCGLFHSFSKAADRAAYVSALARVAKPGATLHMLCFSSEHDVDEDMHSSLGTHGVSRAELKKAFSKGWTIDELKHVEEWPDHYVWLATISRS
jgi:ubiquinone/menaquinone biosynthesis C-methylase UbiE